MCRRYSIYIHIYIRHTNLHIFERFGTHLFSILETFFFYFTFINNINASAVRIYEVGNIQKSYSYPVTGRGGP